MGLLAWLKRLLLGPKKPQQTCWVWCPGCKHELTSDSMAFVYDEADGVLYRCPKCKTQSLWDFDAPTPLLRHYMKYPEPVEPLLNVVHDSIVVEVPNPPTPEAMAEIDRLLNREFKR